MQNLDGILRGLSRGLDPAVLDRGFGDVDGQAVSFYPRARALGVVLPSNSPGVHGLWVPALALKMPLVLRPGSAEPWTPYRLIQAFIKAGIPADAFCFFPSDHAGAGEIVRQCGRSMFFGDLARSDRLPAIRAIELHGPGYSKVLLGPDVAGDWRDHLGLIAASIAENGGRSCVNASGVWTTGHGREIAEALAERLAQIVPRAADDPRCRDRARSSIHAWPSGSPIRSTPGSRSRVPRTSRHAIAVARGWSTRDGSTYLLPTIVHCQSVVAPARQSRVPLSVRVGRRHP